MNLILHSRCTPQFIKWCTPVFGGHHDVSFKHMLLRVIFDVPHRTGAGLADVYRPPDVPHDVTKFSAYAPLSSF